VLGSAEIINTNPANKEQAAACDTRSSHHLAGLNAAPFLM
jgi:hypothetical protein